MSALLKQPLKANLPVAVSAKGVFIRDSAGREYLDGCGGAMTVSIGHGVPEVLEAIAVQSQKISFTYRTQFTSQPAEELASWLVDHAPDGLEHVFFVNSGSEATELAMRAAIQYWREVGQPEKTRVLGRKLSYHGMTMGALSMSGHNARRRDYGNLLLPLHQGPVSDAWESVPVPESDDIEQIDAWIAALDTAGPDTVAAIIVEPVIGASGGALTPPPGHMKRLRELCDAKNVLLIADEVITGLGRTGAWFAVDHDQVVPDMIAMGKGMTSGYTPMGAVLIHSRLATAMKNGSGMPPFGHTFSANPLSAATCLAVVRYMDNSQILDNVRARGAQLEAGLRELMVSYPGTICRIRGMGLLWGFEVHDGSAALRPAPALNANSLFCADCFAEGLILYSAGVAPKNNAVIVSPPLTITHEEMCFLLGRLEAAIVRFAARFFS